MKKFLALLLLLASFITGAAQTPGTSQYPTSLDTTTTLMTAVNLCSTTLNGSVDSSQTTFTVVSTSCYPAAGIIKVEDELVIYASKTSTTFTGLTRAAFGTSAASHANGIATRYLILAQYHNVLRDAVIATQTKLGSGSATAAANQVLRGTGAGTTDYGQIAVAHIQSGALSGNGSKVGTISGTTSNGKCLEWDANGNIVTAASNAACGSGSGGITALTGDVTASGSGSVAATLATVNSNVGSFTNANITVNAKGLITAASNGSGGGSPAWSSFTDPTGNLSLAMGANLTTLTWAGNYSSSSAFKLAGNNTSATGPLAEFSSAFSNNMPVLVLKPRGGQSLKADHLGSVLLGKDSPGNTDTDGYAYFGVVGSNLFPSGTPTSNTGYGPVVLQSNAIAGDFSIWAYLSSGWRDLGGQHKRYDSGSGNGSQTIDFNSSTSAHIARTFTLSGGNATFTFSNAPKAGTLITIILVQDGTGSRTVTWPATVKWSGGTAPTLTTTASKRDVFTFVYDGSNYYNTSQQLNQ